MVDQEIGYDILEFNRRREKYLLSKHACKSLQAIRKNPETTPDNLSIRPAFSRDADRIMHSLAYNRYPGKTQVFSLVDNDHISHRSHHVQFVSKIGRGIGRSLRLNEDLIEAISLGHDLGHVPYGHKGEVFLNKICTDNNLGNFCHNAQSVRVLKDLEARKTGHGLNLTLQVLDGILCHNGELLDKVYEPDYKKDMDRFEEEYNECFKTKGFDKTIRPMTLEGCVMRLCDVISYVGRDVEDAITVNIIERDELPDKVQRELGNTNDQIIDSLVTGVINESYGKKHIRLPHPTFEALQELFDFNYKHIYGNPKLLKMDPFVEKMFPEVFEKSVKDIRQGNKNSSVQKYWLDIMDDEYRETTSPERMAVDYIAGMTDNFFNKEAQSAMMPEYIGMEFGK